MSDSPSPAVPTDAGGIAVRLVKQIEYWRGVPGSETYAVEAIRSALTDARPQPIGVEELRASLHMTYNGGWHHSDDGLKAFHHGMDTVCNVLADWQKRNATPPSEAQR